MARNSLSPSKSIRCAAGLSDYELRDLNDEIKKQMGEKQDWENQIVGLYGAQRRDAGQRWEGCAEDEGVEVRAPFLASRVSFSSLCAQTPHARRNPGLAAGDREAHAGGGVFC
ncbi:hypothetical protein K438DRAFT_1863008 [Mycena galopus ATCC 62051]|nr:hypothetical protein K438DRAFT_1863008 [Mycena galopus ATCC 62051]